MYLKLTCPPLPYFVVAGKTLFRAGDVHERRILTGVCDLIVVTKGCLYMQDGEDRYSVRENEFLVLTPNRLHYGYLPCDEDTTLYWMHFNVNDEFERVLEPKFSERQKPNRKKYYKKSPFNLYLPIYNKVSDQSRKLIIQNMSNLADVDVNHKRREKSFLTPQIDHLQEQQLFLNVLSNVYIQTSIDSQKSLATQVYSYIQAHYDQPFSLAEISTYFSYSKAYIIQAVKKQYQQTPQQIYSHIKLENAKKILIETNSSIESISYDLNYANPSYFIKQFKTTYGYTPLEYRKQFQKI